MKHLLTVTLSAALSTGFILFAQAQTQTVGTFLNTELAYDGYTLLDPMGTESTYLINNCGEVIQSWQSQYNSGGACYLLNDGSLVRGCRVNGNFAGGGVGGVLERRSWEGDLLWTLTWANDELHHHHDFAWMPNGHVLVLAWEWKDANEAAAAGRLNPQTIWPESITEIAPTFPSGGNVVWEWHAWDHLVQNVSPDLPNYGEPADFPQRININHAEVGSGAGGGPGGASSGDWMHANAVNYNPELDQIAISSRRFNEIWIIDHGTSTEEAAGPGGDLLYRYGNPEAYGRGVEIDRTLFGQHDVQWVPQGHPQAGDLLVFNNGNERPGCPCSTIDCWTPPLLEDGTYALDNNAPFGPIASSWSYPESPFADFFSTNISGVQPQPNGNFLICEGAEGKLFEVTQSGQTVWEYVNPSGQFGVVQQGDFPLGNAVFRAYRYGPEFQGFEGRDMTPGAPLEGNTAFSCDLYPEGDSTTTSALLLSQERTLTLSVYPNPASEQVTLLSNRSGIWSIQNALGQRIATQQVSPNQTHELPCHGLPSGIYVATWMDKEVDVAPKTLKFFIRH